jgi:hypothetical protein
VEESYLDLQAGNYRDREREREVATQANKVICKRPRRCINKNIGWVGHVPGSKMACADIFGA